MNEKAEKGLVGHMLHHKEHGYSVLYIFRKSAIRYVILLAAFILCGFLNRKGFLVDGGLVFITGLFIGAVARDIAWIRQSKKVWSLYVKVIDWGKVREIRNRNTPNQSSDATSAPAPGAASSAH